MNFSKSALVSAIILSSAFTLTACDGVEERKTKYMNQANESFESDNYDKAKLGYKNVIQIDPKDVEARVGLAKVLVAEQDFRGAAGQYKGVLEVDPEHSMASIELGKLFLLARATDLAMEEADKVLAREPNNLEAITLKAGAFAQKSDIKQAITLLEKVYSQDPSLADGAILLSSLLSQDLQFEKAIKIVKETLKLKPKNIDLRVILSGIYSRISEFELAIAELEEVIEISPDNFAHKQRLLAFLVQIDRKPQAKEKLEAYIARDHENLEAKKALVDLHISDKEFDIAEQLLVSYIKAFPEEFDFQLGLSRIKLMMNDRAGAIAVLDQAIANKASTASMAKARVEKVRLLLADNKVEDAKGILETVLKEHPDNTDALTIRGELAFREGRSIDAINDFRSILKNDPDDAKIMRLLADTHMQSGEYNLAENYYKKLATRFPNDLAVRNALAKAYTNLNKIDDAVALREELNQKASGSDINNIELAKLYAAKNNLEGLTRVANDLLASEASKATGHYFIGLAHQIKQEHSSAVKAFDEALAIQPKGIEAMSAKVKSLVAQDKSKDAKDWLLSLAEKEDSALVMNLLGEVGLLDKSYAEARKYLDKAIAISSSWLVPYRNKSLAYKSEKDIDNAIATLKEGIQNVEQANMLRLDLAQMLEANKDFDGAIEQYEVLNQQNDAPQFAANNLAMLLVTYKDDQASLDKASKAAEKLRGSTNPLFMDTLGWVYYKRNQIDLALPLIKEAAKKAPQVAQINYHLAMAYYKNAQKETAIQYLEKALASNDIFVGRSDAEKLLSELKS